MRVEVEARVDTAGEGSEGGSAASLADERVTLEDMSTYLERRVGVGKGLLEAKTLVCSNMWLAQGKVDGEVFRKMLARPRSSTCLMKKSKGYLVSE